MNGFRKAKARHIELGHIGETLALRLLRIRNCQKLAANWREGTHLDAAGELDLVVLDGETIVFVEVKTRRKRDHYAPKANLAEHQRQRIRRGAMAYCRVHHVKEEVPKRFDLVEVIHDGRRLRDIALNEGYMPWDGE